AQDCWEWDFFVTDLKGKPFCLICKEKLSVPKRFNVQRHYETRQSVFETKFPTGSALHAPHLQILKSSLASQQRVLKSAISESDVVTFASYRIAWLLAKMQNYFQRESIKECFIESSDILFEDFKNREEIIQCIRSLQLSKRTICRRVNDIADELANQLFHIISGSDAISIALDESKDNQDVAQLCLWDNELNTEEFTELVGLHGRTYGTDIMEAFMHFFKTHSLSVEKIVSITTDGCPSMVGVNKGFVTLLSSEVPNLFSVHCIIHQEAPLHKVRQAVMDKVMQIVNYIYAQPLHHRQFVELLDQLDSKYGDLILHSEVRWLSKGKVLERFIALLPAICQFLVQCSHAQAELDDENWLAFLTDLTCHLNTLNVFLQGKNHLPMLISNVKRFMLHLQLTSTQLQSRDFTHFPHLKKALDNDSITINQYEGAPHVAMPNVMFERFQKHFSSLDELKTFMSLLQNPFDFDIYNSSTKIFEEELLNIRVLDDNVVHNLRKASVTEIWKTFPGPVLCLCAAKLLSIFGSTYTCEQMFSAIGI
uniref:DUF4371 domain-containing protein n=1 Tax=Latimeria chalumnae TaxID=7897 RepID=H3ALC5_LATCH